MEKFHLLSIFYFIINIVIFTSCAAGNDFNDRFEKLLENWQLGDEMETSDSDGSLSDLAESISNRNSKFRRDSTSGESIWQVPVSKIDDDSGNGGRRDLTLDDTGIRYILDRIQARDVNGQTAMTKQTDTFNESPMAATTTINTSRADIDLSKTFINNTFDERPAASWNGVTNSKSSELASVIAALDQMREELELMRMSKQCNSTPDGSDCNVNGAWNSEQIGLRLELENSLTDNKLTVNLSDKAPKKVTPYKIDATWSCTGTTFHSTTGGPFFFSCRKPPMESIAIFQGTCKKCSGYETIFGQWHFQHNPKDCRQMWTFVESKNDIFRKDVLHLRNNQLHVDDIHQVKSINGSGVGNTNINNKSKVRRNIKSNHQN